MRLQILQGISVCLMVGALTLTSDARVTPEVQATIDQLEKFSEAFAAVAADVQPGVVAIVNKKSVRVPVRGSFGDPFLDRFFGVPYMFRREQQQQGLGSGVIVSEDGYILTNNHVIAGADEIVAEMTDGRSFEARLVGTDPQSDVAVLKVDERDLPVIPMGDSDGLKAGAWVLAIGNPFGLRHTVTYGIVSAVGRGNLDLVDYADFIQTDAAINPGNSGGAMVNLRGELIGINTAIFSKSGGNQGIGFAIPINMARNIMRQIVDHGEVVRGYLDVAVQDLTRGIAQAMGVTVQQGAIVQDVAEGGVAASAGLRTGDVIVSVNGRAVKSAEGFRARIAQSAPQSKVKLGVIRDGRERAIQVTLSGLNDEMARADLAARRGSALGIEVQAMTRALARRLGYDTKTGMLVTDVRSGSPASEAGLRPGDVVLEINRQAVGESDDYADALVSVDAGDDMLLTVRREYRTYYRTYYVVLKVPQ